MGGGGGEGWGRVWGRRLKRRESEEGKERAEKRRERERERESSLSQTGFAVGIFREHEFTNVFCKLTINLFVCLFFVFY